MNRKYNLKLDLQFRCNNSTMKFDEFDNNTSDFFIRVTRAGELIDISKAIVTLVVIKPDNTTDAQFLEIQDSKVYANLKPSMKNLIGKYEAIASIVVNGDIANTDPIFYDVNENKFLRQLNEEVKSDERFTLLTDMLSRLSTIELSEEQRVINESERILAEENRKIEEAKRVEVELIRQHEEADRAKYDATRESNENIRKQNEEARISSENVRLENEANRIEQETNRVKAEQLRKDNYNFMIEDEERRRSEANAHKEAEVLRVQAETNRVNEEAKRRTTEQARVSAENTRVSNENTREANEVVRKNNETKRVEAEAQRQNRYNSFIADAEANASNFENYTNNAKIKEEERKANELDRKSQEDRRISNEVERISNENTRKANEVARENNEATRQNTFTNKVNEVDKKIIELNTTKDNFVSSVNTKVDTKISELDTAKSDMTNTVTNKIDEVENRFNALTSKQQQDAEVIDARDGETSLKARLDRDIEKAKQVYVNVEGSHISTDSSVGYAKDVEILGNTIQSASNLADIRSVGDKVEGQELYEIPVVSCGKNLLNIEDVTTTNDGVTFNYSNGVITLSGTSTKDYITSPLISIANILQDEKCYRLSSVGTDAKVISTIRYMDGTNVQWADKVLWKSSYSKPFVYIQVQNSGTNCNGYKIQLQLEEVPNLDTQTTPYEPYQEDKLTILSPTPLEKVGDVADRIIEKDGVWGVEKNITDIKPSFKLYGNHLGFNIYQYTLSDIVDTSVTNKTHFISNNRVVTFNDRFEDMQDGDIYIASSKIVYILSNLDSTNFEEKYNGKVLVKYPTTQPQFIPLPHDQQIKLRTFANKTNISFLTEIEGTIKAQVPKSLGATVNTHTEQINNLNKELNRVKKLEESTVSTVTTESDFTTVEATSNGYFEDVKLEGKTLVNLAKQPTNNGSINHQYATISTVTNIKSSTVYTYIIRNNGSETLKLYLNNNGGFDWFDLDVEANSTVIGKAKTLPTIAGDIWLSLKKAETVEQNLQVVLLEGDHTQNLPSFFEGLKSVGEDTDEIVVSSVNENLFSFDKNKPIDLIEGYCKSIPIYSNDRVYFKGSSNNADNLSNYRNGYININCNNFAFESNTNYKISIKLDIVNNPLNAKAIYAFPRAENMFDLRLNPGTNRYEGVVPSTQYSANESLKSRLEFRIAGIEGYISEIMIQKYDAESTKYTPHQSDKKRLLYYNTETQAWEKPTLREWDSIEKHANGKYYYHQRSGEVVLNGSEDWIIDNNNTRFGLYNINAITGNVNVNVEQISDKFSVYDRYGEKIGSFGVGVGFVRIQNNFGFTTANEFKQWLQANNVTAVYQLAQEKVYECTNIDLITYANETNYIVESGVLSPKTTLKVHSNISNVVSLLQKKVSLLESNMTKYMITQNRLMLASRYNADTVSFKVDVASFSDAFEYDNDLYELILNNVLVGKDNYNREYIENLIRFYWMDFVISDEMYSTLFEIIEEQHNPKIEEETPLI